MLDVGLWKFDVRLLYTAASNFLLLNLLPIRYSLLMRCLLAPA
jgi:hypothetical protein